MPEAPPALARRFVTAIESGDLDAIRAIYAPDARIWHNTDGVDFPGQTVDENLKVLGWMRRVLSDISYDIARIDETPTGYVQQHVLRATTTLGEPFVLPACIICTVKAGRIVRLEEYLDTAHLAPLNRAADAGKRG